MIRDCRAAVCRGSWFSFRRMVQLQQENFPMTVITLLNDLDAALAEQAKQRGTTPELLAVEICRKALASPAKSEKNGDSAGKTAYDLLKDHIGTIEGTS